MINRECFGIFPLVTALCRNTNSIGLAGSACLLAIVLLIPGLPASALAQTQLGADIDGEVAGDWAGYSVSLSSDGHRVAIGSLFNDSNGDRSGHVRVYQWSGTAWEQLGTNIDGESAGDQSGRSVSLSSDGNRLAIGAAGPSVNETHLGRVRVYQWSGADWEQIGTDINGEAVGDNFGYSVSLSSNGDRLAIGANRNDGNGDKSGHVRVYQWSGMAWEQLGADIDGEAAGDQSGYVVSLSSNGSRLAIGAGKNDGTGDNSGHVRVYQWSGMAWEQLGADIDGEAAGDYSGYGASLSSDGTHVAIGAWRNGSDPVTKLSVAEGAQPSTNNDKEDSGHVRVYKWSGADWVQLGADIDGEAAKDHSGAGVSLSSNGQRVAIGAMGNDPSGHVRVYQWTGSVWTQIGIDIDGEVADDMSGGESGVSLSPDANRLAIGATGNDSNGIESGHVRVYDLSMFNVFNINAGLNDAWYYEPTSGQGFFITVFPDLGYISLAWFTYDTDLPPLDAFANLGDPGHRWLTAVGLIDGNRSVMNIEMTSGGIFDTATIIERTDPPGSDGTITLTFDTCNSGTVEYDIPSINRQGIIPIVRVANDNIVICEALSTY